MAVSLQVVPTSDKPRVILGAALSLFVERGFHGTTVPSVAQAAGVGAGTIYRYFESKEALGNALYRDLRRSMTARVTTDFPVGCSARDQFHALWSRLAGWARDNPNGFAFLEFHNHDYLDSESHVVRQHATRPSLRIIEEGQRNGEIKQGPAALLLGVLLGALSGVLRICGEGRLEPSDSNLATAEACCWEALRAPA